MSYKYGDNSCRFPGRFSFERLYLCCSEGKKGNLRFWISSDACMASFCFRTMYIADILWRYIQASQVSLCLYRHNYTLMVGKVGFIVYITALLVGYLRGSVPKVDFIGSVKKKRVISGFGLKVILWGSLCVSGACTLHLYCGIISNIALYLCDLHCFLSKLYTLLTPCINFSGFHAHYTLHWHVWQLGRNTLGAELFRMLLSSHQNLKILVTCCNCSKREFPFKGSPRPFSISSAVDINASLSLLK